MSESEAGSIAVASPLPQPVLEGSHAGRPGILAGFGQGSLTNVLPGPLVVLFIIFVVQIGAAWTKILLAAHSAFTIVLLRIGFAAIVLWFAARPQLGRYSKRQWLYAAMLGVVIPGLSLAFYESVSRIPLGITMTIEFLGPLMVAVCASRKTTDLLWPTMALAGVLLLTPVGNLRSLSVAGLGFGFLSAAAWAAYLILAKRTTAIFSGTTGLTLAMTIGAILVLPFGLLTGSKELFDPSLLANGFCVSMLTTVIPLSLEFMVLKRMSPRTYGILVSGDPAFAALIGLVVLHEQLGLRGWAALALVSIASLGVMSQDAKTQRGIDQAAVVH